MLFKVKYLVNEELFDKAFDEFMKNSNIIVVYDSPAFKEKAVRIKMSGRVYNEISLEAIRQMLENRILATQVPVKLTEILKLNEREN